MPRSTNQTSPRPGTFLLFVKHLESDARALVNIFVRQRLAVKFRRGRSARLSKTLPQFQQKRALVAHRQLPDFVQNGLCFRTHQQDFTVPA